MSAFGKYRILVSGSRDWDNMTIVSDTLRDAMIYLGVEPSSVTLVHGGARGLDSIAGTVATNMGMRVEKHPARWDEYGKSAGMIRNREMVELGASLFIAFPLDKSVGTWGCLKEAQKSGMECWVVDSETGEHRTS